MGRTAYNQAVVINFPSLRMSRAGRIAAGVTFTILVACFAAVCARGQAANNGGAPSASPLAADRGRILLVLQFDNRTGQPSLEWVREAAANLLSSRFRSAGFAPMSRADRMYALDHLGLPQGFQPSRASSLKLAQTLDADSIVVGSYSVDGSNIVAEARLVNVPNLRMSDAVAARGDMRGLIDVFDTLAWKLTRQLDPKISVTEETFLAAGKGLRLEAFEQYIRGITEPDQSERLQHLQLAVKMSPDLGPAWMALGREDYNNQQYDQAAAAFSKVDSDSMDGLEAGYYGGLALLFSGEYAKAEKSFAAVARVLPLAEVLNNEAVAVSRQGHDGTDLFMKAAAEDPSSADYHFNLAVSLRRHGQVPGALNELAQSLKLRPTDAEAEALQLAWKRSGLGTVTPAAQAGGGAGDAKAADSTPDSLERIVRTFDASAFRQAAQMLDQVEAARLAELSPLERAQQISAQAKGFLDKGLLLESERLYQAAVADDGNCPEAHAGLAAVRERAGDANGARMEAHQALALKASADVYLVLGRLDLASNRLSEADSDAAAALKLEPSNREAQELARQIQAKQGH
jgi:tetratricopeptide (TPR) repeat protein